ncbi:hypothetical protein HD806DRAFT_545165 [Xylariaceae sp. AK1471]|nr:hypothetical protein HD806DRAFT_545165 [Xylariaceae sp. AK1471]
MFELLGPCKAFTALLLAVVAHSLSSGHATTFEITDQGDDGPPPALTTGCINLSFAAPTWTIDSFNYEDSDDASTVGFSITSNTVQEQLSCSGQTGGHRHLVAGNCHKEGGQEKYSAQFNFDTSAGDLYIDQTWACDDNAARIPVTFVGTGMGRLPLNCDSGKCAATTSIRIPARLLKPIEVTPYIPPAPAGHDVPGCINRSASPSWEISGLDWRTGGRNYTWQSWTTSGWGITGVGMVRLNITNQANKQKHSCVWQSNWSETSNVTMSGPPPYAVFYPLDLAGVWYRCDTHSLDEVENRTHNYETETSVRLISSENRILVNQTWYCDDEGSASPVQFHALGAIELLSLRCRERTVIEPDAENLPSVPAGTPVINGSVCIGPDFNIEGLVETRYVMEPYALELPNPTASKCIVHSFDPDKQYFQLDTSTSDQIKWWYFDNNTTYRDSEGKPSGGVDITIRSFISERYPHCTGWSSKLNPNQSNYDPDFWFDCSKDMNIPMLGAWKANYNANTNVFSVGVAWDCDELSPGNPITFTAFGRGELSKPECHDEDDGTSLHNVTRCEFPAAADTLSLPFTNITWSEPYGI